MAMANGAPIDKLYDRCAYLNCYNGKNSTGHRLYRFPAYDDARHNLWIRYTGNARLRMWSSATIRRSGICGEHFGPESFTDETRRSLRRHAVPKPYSATDARAKPSCTLLAHVESLPRKRMTSRKFVEADDSRKDLASKTPSDSPNPNGSLCAFEKSTSAQTRIADTVKTLRKVRMIKIEEQNSNVNGTVILERCKDPETCPASIRSTQIGAKHRPHFHKVCVKNSKIARATSASLNNPGIARRTGKIVSDTKIDDERSEETREDSTKVDTAGDEECSESMRYRLQRYLINVTESTSREPTTTTCSNERQTQSNKEIARSVCNSDIHTEKGEPTTIRIPDYISQKHPTTTELVKEYYRTKEERFFDRCAYLNCKNGRFATGARLFRFPKFTDPRFNTWIKNAGNPRILYWSSATIRRAGLCGEHFTDESFFNETRQRLLRSALPKPFYLDTKKLSGTKLQDENLTRDDLIRIFEGLDEDVCDETERALIDLPDGELDNGDDLKVKHLFENGFTSDENEDEPKAARIAKVTVKNEPSDQNRTGRETESFCKMNVKNEPLDRSDVGGDRESSLVAPERLEYKSEHFNETEEDSLMNDDDTELSFTSERIDFKNELIDATEKEPLLDDDSCYDNPDFEGHDDDDRTKDIRGILALEQEKIELCKTIKQFATKLKDAKLRKKKLRSQLLAYNQLTMH